MATNFAPPITHAEYRIFHNDKMIDVEVSSTGGIDISVSGVWAGRGWYIGGRIENCAAVLDDGAYEAIEQAIASRSLNGQRVVEYMPTYLRASHEAAGNSGAYPANGAVRRIVGVNEEVDEDEWTSVVRTATVADLARYSAATETDYNDGMSA